MSLSHLVVLSRDQDDYSKNLQSKNLPELDISYPKNDMEIEVVITSADILLAEPPLAAKWINHAKKLRWMQSTFTGVDAMMASGLRQNYLLTNLRETYGTAIAEYTMGYILYLEKEIALNQHYQQQKRWEQRPTNVLTGKIIGILGTGSLGSEIARISKAFGLQTIGYRSSNQPQENFDRIVSGEDLQELLRASDYIIATLPATQATTHLLDTVAFEQMKETAIFISVGRGNIVDEKVLVGAMKHHRIAAAVLDVFAEEPLAPKSPLWDMQNVYITPHNSGYILSDRIFDVFEENYHRFRNGEELLYTVDFTKGY